MAEKAHDSRILIPDQLFQLLIPCPEPCGDLFCGVVKEPAAALYAIFPFLIMILQSLRDLVGVAKIRDEIFCNVVENVEAAEIHGFERTHAGPADAQTVFKHAVDIFFGGAALIHQGECFSCDGHLDADGGPFKPENV